MKHLTLAKKLKRFKRLTLHRIAHHIIASGAQHCFYLKCWTTSVICSFLKTELKETC
jgi:hypothetical protein